METDSAMESEWMFVNGIDGATGDYARPPERLAAFAAALGQPLPPKQDADLQLRRRADEGSQSELARLRSSIELLRSQVSQLAATDPLRILLSQLEAELMRRQHLGVRDGINARALDQAGWGIICATDEPPATLLALEPLLARRRAQAGRRFRSYTGERGYRSTDPRESKSRFLVRSGGAAAGLCDPERVPYYLLIVGDPARVPFEFQHQLDVQYAVGRLHFDSPAEYARYAQAVLDVEDQPRAAAQLVLFGPRNDDDRATELSASGLLSPLYETLEGTPQWERALLTGPAATKARLGELLAEAPPALLFTASHGLQFPGEDARQRTQQGALLCQDWPGPEAHHGPPDPEHYFCGADLPRDADLRGLLVFSFACFSAGTPRLDSFAGAQHKTARPLTTDPFVAELPRRLLSHPGGPALAVIGHVDRAWGYSFAWPGAAASAHTAAFEDLLRRLMNGDPVGYALEPLNQRYAELATTLCDELADRHNGKRTAAAELALLWTAAHDARGYLLLGDPAVCVRPQRALGPPAD